MFLFGTVCCQQSNPLAGYFLWFEFSFRYYGLSLFVHSTRLKYRGFDWIGCHILPRFQVWNCLSNLSTSSYDKCAITDWGLCDNDYFFGLIP